MQCETIVTWEVLKTLSDIWMMHCQELTCCINYTLLQVSLSDKLIAVSFMWPAKNCEQKTGCILIWFKVNKLMWMKIQIIRVTQLTKKIWINQRSWSTRARRRWWTIVGVIYDLVGVLLIIISNLAILLPTSHSNLLCSQWSMINFKNYSCTDNEHIDEN